MRLRDLQPLRWGSISLSILSPLTTRKIWFIIPLSRADRTYELKTDNGHTGLPLVADLPPLLRWIGGSDRPVLADSEETRTL